jgi:hypothetical protein
MTRYVVPYGSAAGRPFTVQAMPSAPIRVAIRAAADLDQRDWDEVVDFGSRFFEGAFADSLRAKRELVLLRGGDGRLVGMGAVETFAVTHAGRTVGVIHAGNTAFADEARGQGYVQRLGFRFFLRAKARRPWRAVYLAYTTFSWRSYLMLTRNFDRSWPSRREPLPAWEAGLYARLGARLLGERYDPAAGVARNLDRRLRAGIAAIPQRLADDPDVAYFSVANPGYASGDVLLCLAPLSLRNWRAVARGMLRRRRPR